MFLEFHESYAVAIKSNYKKHSIITERLFMIVFCMNLKPFLPVSTEPHGTDITRNEGTEQQEDVCFGNVV